MTLEADKEITNHDLVVFSCFFWDEYSHSDANTIYGDYMGLGQISQVCFPAKWCLPLMFLGELNQLRDLGHHLRPMLCGDYVGMLGNIRDVLFMIHPIFFGD